MKNILLIGCGGSAGYNFVESLRLSGEKYTIIGTDINREHLELSNCDIKYLVPRNTEKNYIETINKIIKNEKIDFVHIQPDIEVAFWSKNREKLNSKYNLPSKEAIELCHNKLKFNKALNDNGINVPESYGVDNKFDLRNKFDLLKKRNSKIWVRAIRGAGSRASLPVTNIKHAEMWIDYWITEKKLNYDDFMIAEYLPGKEYAFQSIWDNGTLVTSQARERKEYVFGNIMPSGQSSSPSVAMTVHNKKVNDIAVKAILASDKKPNGIYCVDMKENISGEPAITEINIGRFFTTNDFFSVAGNNMPDYYVKLALNEKIPVLKQFDSIKKNLYWLRIIDMGKKILTSEEWNYKKI